MSILEVKGLQYSYESKRRVLRSVNAKMEQGKMYAILGPSGCGKTTLLSLLGGLDSPSRKSKPLTMVVNIWTSQDSISPTIHPIWWLPTASKFTSPWSSSFGCICWESFSVLLP